MDDCRFVAITMSYAPVVQHPALTCAVLFSCSELKIMQKVITLAVFVPFAVV